MEFLFVTKDGAADCSLEKGTQPPVVLGCSIKQRFDLAAVRKLKFGAGAVDKQLA